MNMLLNCGGTHFVLMRTLHLHTLLNAVEVPLYPISEKAHRNYIFVWDPTTATKSHLVQPSLASSWPQNLLWGMQLANCSDQFHCKDVTTCLSCLLEGVLLARLLPLRTSHFEDISQEFCRICLSSQVVGKLDNCWSIPFEKTKYFITNLFI